MKPDTLPKMIESTKCDAAEVTEYLAYIYFNN